MDPYTIAARYYDAAYAERIFQLKRSSQKS